MLRFSKYLLVTVGLPLLFARWVGAGQFVRHSVESGRRFYAWPLTARTGQGDHVDLLVNTSASERAWRMSIFNDPSDPDSISYATVDGDAYWYTKSLFDYENDGDIDIVGIKTIYVPADTIYDTIRLYLNDGGGNFRDSLIYECPFGTEAIAGADLDGDGDMDVACATSVSNMHGEFTGAVFWLENNNDEFAPHTIIPEEDLWWESGYSDVEVADLNEDGLNDIVTANASAGYIIVCMNNGDRTFTADTLEGGILVGLCFPPVAVADLDADGDMDIISTWDTFEIGWWENDGDAQFSYHKIAGYNTHSGRVLCISNLDGDNYPDFLTANYWDGVINWFRNDGAEFSHEVISDSAGLIYGLAVGDLNGDGLEDIVQGSDGALYWWEQTNNAVTPDNQAPSRFTLFPSNPNPFNSSVRISFAVPYTAPVNVALYDLSGREIRQTNLGVYLPGDYAYSLSVTNLASGTYLLRLMAGDRIESATIQLVR